MSREKQLAWIEEGLRMQGFTVVPRKPEGYTSKAISRVKWRKSETIGELLGDLSSYRSGTTMSAKFLGDCCMVTVYLPPKTPLFQQLEPFAFAACGWFWDNLDKAEKTKRFLRRFQVRHASLFCECHCEQLSAYGIEWAEIAWNRSDYLGILAEFFSRLKGALRDVDEEKNHDVTWMIVLYELFMECLKGDGFQESAESAKMTALLVEMEKQRTDELKDGRRTLVSRGSIPLPRDPRGPRGPRTSYAELRERHLSLYGPDTVDDLVSAEMAVVREWAEEAGIQLRENEHGSGMGNSVEDPLLKKHLSNLERMAVVATCIVGDQVRVKGLYSLPDDKEEEEPERDDNQAEHRLQSLWEKAVGRLFAEGNPCEALQEQIDRRFWGTEKDIIWVMDACGLSFGLDELGMMECLQWVAGRSFELLLRATEEDVKTGCVCGVPLTQEEQGEVARLLAEVNAVEKNGRYR